MTLAIRLTAGTAIVGQIEQHIRGLVETRTLRAGARLPSVRRLAADLAVSTFTVAAAYDRLSASNHIRPRGTAGYFVVEKQLEPAQVEPPRPEQLGYLWLLRALRARGEAIPAGAGVLPASWFSEDALRRSARAAIRKSGSSLCDYPSAMGLHSLRNLLALKLIDLGISAQADQILLTNGASHALDLVIRTLVAPGDTVVIEEPGYYLLPAYLRSAGISFVTVPRRSDGIDLDALDCALKSCRATLLIVNSALHNPTGYSLGASNAHRLLALAEHYGARILEDDIYGDFQDAPALRIANLDQLSRVVYVSSFSKTVSANLRCGFVAADKALIVRLQDRKRITCIATSEITERIIGELLAAGEFRRQTEGIRHKLAAKLPGAVARLESLGFEVPYVPAGGFFVWARAPDDVSMDSLAEIALDCGVVLAPGSLFAGPAAGYGWARFNVAYCDSGEFERRMDGALAQLSRR